jgi:hypothetical protein
MSGENIISSHLTGEAIIEVLSASESLSRESRIAVAAYYLAEKRGFAPGGELEDWLDAERDQG